MLKRIVLCLMMFFGLAGGPALAATDPLAAWKPTFDPSGAEYTYLVSNVGHPAIEGVSVGFKIRDRVWEESGGRLYVDYRPLSQLGGEKDVLAKLKLGAIHGMMSSSVMAPNVDPRLGLVNLPFLFDSFAKLDRFRDNETLFAEYGAGAEKQGIKVVDFTGYGSYGWATNSPVGSLEDARKMTFRIAQAPVNIDLYRAWGLQFTVMPWPDVPQALQTGVITGLDHTPIVCSISKKFTVAKNFTGIDYAQGLYIHLMNKRWFDKLPQDLQQILIKVIREESAKARAMTEKQQQDEIAKSQAAGVNFVELPEAEIARLTEMAEPIVQKWGEKIGLDYLTQVREYLAE
jgi:TRAP-type C4-dicarboxylate transport system substrate-binding protein